jgi:hypothetical protein
MPILLRDVYDAGLHRVVGTLAHALRDPIEDKLPLVRVRRCWSLGAAGSRSCPWRGHWRPPGSPRWASWRWCRVPHNANHGAADHLGALVRDFLRQRVQAQGGQAS